MTETNYAEQNAQGWIESILAWQEAYNFCAEGVKAEGKYLTKEAKAVLYEHDYDGTNHDVVAEWIEDECRESVLSVETREGWRCPGEKASMEPTEFRILLSAGGPALRIIGELNHGEPSRAWMEYQDWGTPWIRFHSNSPDRPCLWFASLFFYGE